METINLKWKNPQNISVLNFDNRCKGIYIWGFRIKNFVPYYIGVSNDIMYRLLEHVNNLIGGKYTIFHKDSLYRFYEYKNKGLQKNKSEGIIYIPNWPTKYYIDFIKERKKLIEHLDFMVDNFTFSYSEISNDINKADLIEIESACIKRIDIKRLANTKTVKIDESKYKIEHSGCETIIRLFD